MRNNLKTRRNGVVSKLLNLIYPSSCPFCKNSSDNYFHSPICSDCWKNIKMYTGPSCSICAAPLVSEHSITCQECLERRPKFSKVLNYGIYADVLAEAIHLMKFSKLRRLAKPLGSLLLDLDIPKYDGIVPVPLSSNSLKTRGFNQSLLISKGLSEKHKIPVYIDILVKTRETLPQIGLNARERIKNLKGSFKANKINGMRLLLVDDVMTTGATARECSKVLMKAGAEDVIIVTLARPSRM